MPEKRDEAASQTFVIGRGLFWILHLVLAGGFFFFSRTIVAKFKEVFADMLPGQPLPTLAQFVFTANQPPVLIVFLIGLVSLPGLILILVRSNRIAFGTSALILVIQVVFFTLTLLALYLPVVEIVSGIEQQP